MKNFAVALTLLISSSMACSAADEGKTVTPPTKPICGKTVPECQTKFDELNGQIANMQTSLQQDQRTMGNYAKLLAEANGRVAVSIP